MESGQQDLRSRPILRGVISRPEVAWHTQKLSSSALRLDEREKDTETRDQHWVRHQCTNRLSSSALRLDEREKDTETGGQHWVRHQCTNRYMTQVCG